MLDSKFIRDCPEIVKEFLTYRQEDLPAIVDRYLAVNRKRRNLQEQLDADRASRNASSKRIGELMKEGKREAAEQAKRDAAEINERIKEFGATQKDLETQERDLLLSMPNMPHDSIPVGGEECAEIVKQWGEPRQYDFELLDHMELSQRLRLVNFEAGARLSGSGFPVMTGGGAMLQRALINLMLDVHINRHGYTELRPPFIVRPHCAVGTGNLPKFGDDMYHVNVVGEDAPDGTDGPHFFLIPTAEMALCNVYRDQIIEAPVLPLKLCAYSPCWRVEGGSYGKEARGLTRLHQFEKVELVRIADPETSFDDLEELTGEAEHILQLLDLPYRRKVLPSGDMAFPSAKTYDLELHCPAEDAWREISSASNTTDYQARRANIRYRREQGARPQFPHLLNASGLALPRLMIAIMETYQTAAGHLAVPRPLQQYLAGITEFTPEDSHLPLI